MPLSRDLPRPPARIRAARLVNGDIQPLIGGYVEPHVLARQQLLELWDKLSMQGRKSVLTVALLVTQEEELSLDKGSAIIPDSEIT